MNRTNLKILTYNIHKGFSSGNRRFILRDIRRLLRNIDADIVFLQEIYGAHSVSEKKVENWPDASQFEFLADEIWHHHAYGKNAIYKNGHHGNAILSKYPFVEWENIDVSLMRTASRSLLHGSIEIVQNKQKIHVICVHLGLFGREREKQLATLIRRINSHVPVNEPLLIAGDFNDWRSQAEKHFTNDLGVKEVFKNTTGDYARTFPAWLPLLSMDRIYSRGLEVISCKHLRGHPWHKLSDHIPLFAEFSL